MNRGVAMALGAALFWGVIPIYFKWLGHVDALQIVAHRVLWAVPMLVAVMAFTGSLADLRAATASRRMLLTLSLSALFIAANWLIYVWAVHADQILAASLGYFISPLLNVALGTLVFAEKLRPMQWIAIFLALVGVGLMAAGAWQTLWISLLLAGTWAAYSLVRKLAPVSAVAGLAVETALLWPAALLAVLLALQLDAAPASATAAAGAAGAARGFGSDWATSLLLIGGAGMTTIPLVLFAGAVTRISFSALGMMQYVAPSMQFLIAIFVYGEPLGNWQLLCFCFIWTALALYSADSLRSMRSSAKQAPV